LPVAAVVQAAIIRLTWTHFLEVTFYRTALYATWTSKQ